MTLHGYTPPSPDVCEWVQARYGNEVYGAWIERVKQQPDRPVQAVLQDIVLGANEGEKPDDVDFGSMRFGT